MTLPAVESLIDKLSQALTPYFSSPESQPVIVGIETGGAWIAERLQQRLAPGAEIGRLNISFYRDDFTRSGLHPTVKPSSLPTEIDDKTIVLVDDVLHSGRTVRAAMNELFDYGRPRRILLAILIDRGEREIPIQADVIGATMELDSSSHIKLEGPEPLRLVIKTLERRDSHG
ncbi:MAG TPA: bifunctional pyr operon transcriptional regulator/uracil phosphoribosyltransferase PyrR [Gammaproteobacteria bacterium]|nr:bifunctional pyr operon transcriptional regulator/uracil phosphoribosyltransferase PyrR [Gammaproteobacteria bacterium]